jgi:hypothetical protein
MKILAELALAAVTVIIIVTLAALLVEPAHAALHPAARERAPALISVAWAGEVPVSCPICWGHVRLIATLYGVASAGAAVGFITAAMLAAGGRS